MQITQEQHDRIVAAIREWYPHRPALLLADEDNSRLIIAGMIERLRLGAPITAQGVRAVVDCFTGYGFYGGIKGVLKYASASPNGNAAAPAPPSNPVLNQPHANEPSLKNIRCLEDIASEHGQEIIKRVMQSGGHGVGGTRHALLDKLNERLAYIQTHRIKRSQLPPTEQARTNTVEDTPELTEVQARVAKIREDIARESTGGRGGYSEYAQKKNARLNHILDELLRDPSRQLYFRRDLGEKVKVTGLEAVERIMADAIHDADNPIR